MWRRYVTREIDTTSITSGNGHGSRRSPDGTIVSSTPVDSAVTLGSVVVPVTGAAMTRVLDRLDKPEACASPVAPSVKKRSTGRVLD